MAPSIGLNLRVTGYKHQGGRKYMEDEFGVAYQQTADEKDLEYAFFGIFDGHGGREAALFAKEHLMDFIVRQKGFWAEDDDSVLKAIHEGFIQTHYAMWKELEKWPKTASGLPSTAGTTASIAFIRRGKIFIGHVGDSAIILGSQDPDNPDIWRAEPLTRDHKPESLEESERISQCGGKVICKSGVPRVVWNRPKMGHKGPVRRSTHIDEIPFLAVARSLGDLWSYNSEENVFVVSPEPDIRVYPVDITRHRCLVLGTDGAWNMLTAQNAISTVCMAEKANEQHMLNPVEGKTSWINPSKQLVDCAIDRWNASKLRADNTSVVTVMLDPPGPPRAQVLKNRKRELAALNAGRALPNPGHLAGDRGSVALVTNTTAEDPVVTNTLTDDPTPAPHPRLQPSVLPYNQPNPLGGAQPAISIINRFPNAPSASAPHPSSLERVEAPPGPPQTHSSRLPLLSSPVDNTVQCNEISSSEDTPSPALPNTSKPEPVMPSVPDPLPSTSSVTVKTPIQEKASDRSPDVLGNRMSTRGSARNRTVSEHNSSDAENDARLSPRHNTKKGRIGVPNKLKDVEKRCQELNKKIELMEQKVVKTTAQLNQEVKSFQSKKGEEQVLEGKEGEDRHFLRSSDRLPISTSGTSSRVLRNRASTPRGSGTQVDLTPSRPLCGVKRKQGGGEVDEGLHLPSKSPRTVVGVKRPAVTKSRCARVLRLKK